MMLQLKQQVTPSNMAAITPLKKTPPHFMCAAEELANLSPPKPSTLTQRDLTAGLTSQSSLGFHPLYFTGGSTDNDGSGTAQNSDDRSSASSEESGSEEEEVKAPGDQQPERGDTSSIGQHSSNQVLGNVHRQHFAALLQQPALSPPPKKRRKRKGQDLVTSKKHKMSDHLVSNTPVVDCSASRVSNSLLEDTSSLLVSIPLTEVKIGKPKATVEPYNVRSTASNRRNTLDSIAEAEEAQNRDRYSRLGGLQGEDYSAGLLPLHDYHVGAGGGAAGRGERSRAHGHGGTARWERDVASRDHRGYGIPSRSSGRGGTGDYGGRSHGHSWDREPHYRGSNAPSEEYWSDASHYEGARMEPQRGVGRTYPRKMDPEYFMLEARRRKKEADKIMVTVVHNCEGPCN